MKLLYRLYIDEVGNHDLRPDLDENERFLSLFGVATTNREMMDVIQPDVRKIKQDFFVEDPDEPIIFHRKDITRFRGPFKSLYADHDKRMRFGNAMLQGYAKWDFIAFLVTIDKSAHFSTYSVWRHEPYHYCLMTMLERYVLFLHYTGNRGDAMIESRGTKPDQRLQKSYRRLFKTGSNHIPASRMQDCLTSSEIKIRAKKADITGLQLADLMAHAAHYDHLAEHKFVERHTSEYSVQIARILNNDKFHRNGKTGVVTGYGKKLLP